MVREDPRARVSRVKKEKVREKPKGIIRGIKERVRVYLRGDVLRAAGRTSQVTAPAKVQRMRWTNTHPKWSHHHREPQGLCTHTLHQ